MDIKDFGAILGGVAAFGGTLLAWVKWTSDVKKTSIGIASSGNAEIQQIISDIAKSPDIEIVSVVEITNGGGIPEIGKPLYMRSLFSTDTDTLNVYSEKFLLGGVLISTVSNTILNGDAFFTKKMVESDHVLKAWFESKGVERCHHFLIGVDKGKRVLSLVANFKTEDPIKNDEYLELIANAKHVKRVINSNHWFRKIMA